MNSSTGFGGNSLLGSSTGLKRRPLKMLSNSRVRDGPQWTKRLSIYQTCLKNRKYCVAKG